MSISTRYAFDQASQQMSELQTRIAKTQNQLATGMQISKPSDDPEKVVAIQRLQSAIVRQDSYASTLATVGDRLAVEESSVRGASDVMSRVKELAVQAANGTLGPADRANIAAELDSLKADLLAFAGSRDIDGNYLFAGTRSSQQPFAAGPAGGTEYRGDQSRINVSIGEQRLIAVNRPGSQVFSSVARNNGAGAVGVGFFQVLDDLRAAVRASDQSGMQRSLDEVDQLQTGLSHALAQIGADQNTISSQKTRIDETKLRLQTTLSTLSDSDYTEAITRLQKETLSLQAAQSSFAKTSSLSLFNYLK